MNSFTSGQGDEMNLVRLYKTLGALQSCKKLEEISKAQKIKQKWGRRVRKSIEMGHEDMSKPFFRAVVLQPLYYFCCL